MEVRLSQLFRVFVFIFLLIITHSAFSQKCNITLQLQKQDPSCNGSVDGSINLSINGAVEPINVHWSNGERSRYLNNLPAGIYTVFILDGNGCSMKRDISLTNTSHFTPEVVVRGLDQSNPEVIISSQNSTIKKAYFTDYSNLNAIRKLEYQDETIRNIPSGNYMVDIVDERGCVSSHSLVLNNNE